MECLHGTTQKPVLALLHVVIRQSRIRLGQFPGVGGLMDHVEGKLAPSDPDGRGGDGRKAAISCQWAPALATTGLAGCLSQMALYDVTLLC